MLILSHNSFKADLIGGFLTKQRMLNPKIMKRIAKMFPLAIVCSPKVNPVVANEARCLSYGGGGGGGGGAQMAPKGDFNNYGARTWLASYTITLLNDCTLTFVL